MLRSRQIQSVFTLPPAKGAMLCVLSHISRLTSQVSFRVLLVLSHVSRLTSQVSFRVLCVLSQVSRLTSHVSFRVLLVLSHVSRLTSHVSFRVLFVLSLISSLTSHVCLAQDIHFTQFNFSPLNQNPANTALFDGDIRFVGNYKNQWQSVPVAYNTASVSADMNFVTLRNHDKIGGGVLFYFDRAGDSKFTSLHAAYSMSYQLNFGTHDLHTISLGYQIGIVNRSFDYTNLFFDNQFNGDAFNPNLPSTEVFSRTNFVFLDMSLGLAYKWNKGMRNNFTIGASIAHFNMPSQSFYGDHSVTLAPMYNFHFRGQFKIASRLDLVPEFLFQRQQTRQEFVPGIHLKTYITNSPISRIAINTGAYYRVGDAPAIMVGMDYNNLQVNCSYDINHSNFTPASRYNGGFEISVIYIISKIKKLKTNFASCPIF